MIESESSILSKAVIMICISLMMSILLLVIVNLIAITSKRNVGNASLIGFTIAVMCLLTWGPIQSLFLVQPILIYIVAMLWKSSEFGDWDFRCITIGITFAIYSPIGLIALQRYCELDRLQRAFPYESIQSRIPLLPDQPANVREPRRLDEIEKGVLDKMWDERREYRSEALKQVHENWIEEFIRAPDFGFGRMHNKLEERVKEGLHNRPSPKQPGGVRTQDRYSDVPGELFAADAEESLSSLHHESVIEFVDPRGFGFVKDRDHVAGFQSHGFSRVPKASANWKVGQIELVSLLMHPEPVVYVSHHLPRMDELKGVPTRSLDAFENNGLSELRRGENLYIRGDRMMGSIRCVKQCVACHGGNRGQLLGAFSYILIDEKE